MKKHFLLLLMAFFSLTGWAADLSKGSIIAPSPYYGTALTGIEVEIYNEAGTLLTEGTDYALVGYFSDANCTNEVTFDDVIDHIGDTYYVKVSGINLYENSLIASFMVKKMPLTVTLTNKSKTYLENDPEPVISSVKDENNANAPADIVSAIVITREEGNTVRWKEDGSATLPYLYLASLTNDKYSIKKVVGGLTINPKHFIGSGASQTVTVTATANLTYNGAEQKATVTVKDNALNQNLAETTDFVITWSDNTAAGDAAKASVKAAEKGNYDATDAAIVETFSIKKAPLLVTPNPTKVYDGEATMPAVAAAAFSYQGFVDDMTADDVTVTTANIAWALADGVTASPNVGEYAAVITNTDGFSLDNYRFVAQPGTFTITELETLKVTATSYTGDDAIEYGAAENFTFTLTDATYVGTDEDALKNAIEVVKSEEPGEDTYYDLTPAFKTEAKINAMSGLTDAQKTAAIAATKNYKLVPANITVGDLQYKNAALMIALKESAYDGLTKVYDGQAVSVTLDKVNGLIISPATATVDLDELKLTVVEKVEGAGTANVGTYRLELSGAKATNYDITYVPSQYKVTKRTLPITVGEQTFIKGEALNLDQTLYTFGTGENAGLASTDEATEVFKLTTTIAEGGDPKVITSDAGNYEINVVDCGAEGSKWGNYDVVVAAGNTTAAHVVAAATLLDTSAENGITTVAEANANVTISSDRVLNPEAWNAMVLPFEVSVAQLSETFGYAIVNRLNTEATTADAVKFSLEMKSIPANEPFLVKVVGNKTGSEYKAFSLNGVTFKGVNLVVAASTPIEAAGNKFTGVYKAQELLGSTYGFLYDDPAGVRENKWYTPRNNAYTIQPLDAFLTYATAKAPTITVEDIDGTITAIKSISAGEFQEIKAEGWYTLGGMKLQGAPTQKGVYIKNGKKFVIK